MRNLHIQLALFLLVTSQVCAQESRYFSPIIEEIGILESNRDPKCHATAARLENFMYGTPLDEEARQAKIDFERALVRQIWTEFSRLGAHDSIAPLKEIQERWFHYERHVNGTTVRFPSGIQLRLNPVDIRQYGTVAYSLRAMLSVRQSFLFETETLADLHDQQLAYFINSLDIAALSVLQIADEHARKEDHRELLKEDIVHAVLKLFPDLQFYRPSNTVHKSNAQDQASLLKDIIAQKLEAYDQYNHISQSIFLRNLQVFFTRIPWPADVADSDSLKVYFTETMVQFSKDVLLIAQSMAVQQDKIIIEYLDAYRAIQVYLPHEVNDFEDVVYFPALGKQRVTIESYDLDAFRDSGLHWKYLLAALKDVDLGLAIAPDPHALEMLVEGIAQFAVLYLRIAGENGLSKDQKVLEINNLEAALQIIQGKITQQASGKTPEADHAIQSSVSESHMASSEPFTEITDALGLNFEHRNSDWLSRLIRSYVLKEDEQLARLAIPPAFGGAGVATGDIDNDGWDDILLLGGMGNTLYKNDGGQRFIDITSASGLNLPQVDGSYGEPRQPIIVDFNNDGLQDILITYVNAPHQLYRNLGSGHFENMSEHAGLGGTGLVGGPATAFDFDRDGLLDVYIGYFGNYLAGQLPTLKRHNDNGSPNVLFKNIGNFKFEDVSWGSGTENAGWTQAVGHSDFNGDGWQDLIVGNDFGTNAYYLNMQDGSFRDISEDLGTNKPSYTMNIGIADLNKDFLPDFYISNIVVMEKDDKYVLPNEETVAHFDLNSLKTMRVMEANDLFLSSRDTTDAIYYINSTAVDRGFGNTGWSWDADFFDFDLDGDEDLYCVTGMNPYSVYGQENEYYSGQDSTRKPVTFASSQEDRNVLFVNEKGKLNLVEDVGGLNYIGTSRSAAFFDFDHDGDLDVVVNDYQGKARLFRNNADQAHRSWVNIDLKSNVAGVTKDAIGTVVILRTPDGGIQWKEVHSTTGYLSVHPKQLNFGLGENATFDLEIRWPDGQVQMIHGLVRNQFYQFTESP